MFPMLDQSNLHRRSCLLEAVHNKNVGLLFTLSIGQARFLAFDFDRRFASNLLK